MRDERRVVTAVFADVVGSTALAERHDPEEARLIVGEAIARAVRIVESYGGTVKDLAGDGMLALFGAPVAHEDDPERALRAALDIAAAVTDYSDEVRRGWGVEGFGIRLGVETGEVVVGEIGAGSRVEYGATGDAVNVAARLQSAAQPGTVLVGPATRRLASDRFTWDAVQELALKGRSETVAAATASGIRADARAARPTLAPLTGRERELGDLVGAVDALQTGRGGIVFLSGEPGIGKSRLTLETREAAAERGVATWLEGRAVSYGASLAWWPVRDLLRSWIGVGTQEPELRVRLALKRRLEELLPERAAEIQPYLAGVLGLAADPSGAGSIAGLSPEALQFQTYELLTDLVAALAERQPLVLAIDDLHWADATSLGLLDRLLPLAERVPLLLFFNHRPETAHASWALREKAAREYRHLLTTVDLRPLERAAELALLEALGEGSLSRDVEERLIDLADGNPLYLEELARSLGEGGAPAAGATVLPATLEGAILARLDRLEPPWRDVITAAAACGRTFSFALLQAASGAEEADLRAALHNLLRLDLLQEERRWPDASYRFKHALIQEAAYRTLTRLRREELHAGAAEWLEERYGDRPERVFGLLAHHWLQAANSERAAHYLRLAGEQAMGEWSLDEAARHFRDLAAVLREAGRESEAATPLFQLGYTLNIAMRFHEANEAWERAAALWSPPEPGDAPTATVVVGMTRIPFDADTFRGYYASNLWLTHQIEDALFALRPGPSIEPLIARRLEVDDRGLRYRIHLNPDQRFNSGRKLDAAAVVQSFKEALRRSIDATNLWVIEGAESFSRTGEEAGLGIEAIDNLTAELRLIRPYPGLAHMMIYPQFGAALPDERTGPHRLTEMTDERVVAELEPAYPRVRTGNVARIEVRRFRPEDVVAELDGGALDIIAGGLSALPPGVRGGAAEVAGPIAFLLGLAPVARGLPVDAALRRALALATDRERIRQVLTSHQHVATGGIVPPGLPGHTPGAAPPFDPDGARHALQDSTHRGTLRAAYYQETVQPSLMEIFEGWREMLGMDVEAVPISIRDNIAAAAEVHVIQMNWIAAVPDPAYFIYELLHSGSRSNIMGTADPDLDNLLDRAETAPDGSTRLAIYHEADRLVVAGKHLAIPILYADMVAILQPWIEVWRNWANPTQRFSELRVLPSSPRYSPR